MRAVLDRIENGLGIVLIESINKEFTVAKSELPAGSNPGTWFQVTAVNNQYKIASIDVAATKSAASKTSSLADKLQSKKGNSKYKR